MISSIGTHVPEELYIQMSNAEKGACCHQSRNSAKSTAPSPFGSMPATTRLQMLTNPHTPSPLHSSARHIYLYARLGLQNVTRKTDESISKNVNAQIKYMKRLEHSACLHMQSGCLQKEPASRTCREQGGGAAERDDKEESALVRGETQRPQWYLP